jgi:preprotein translocase subunit SecA
VTQMLSRVELAPEPAYQPPPQPMFAFQPEPEPVYAGVAPEPAMLGSDGNGDLALAAAPTMTQGSRTAAVDPDVPATWGNTPRNAACPCGSGKKYKHCHGRLA